MTVSLRHFFPLFLFLSGCSEREPTGFNPYPGPEPMVVLLESNPWSMVVGSDTPSLVVYQDGTVICAKKEDRSVTHLTARLEPNDLDKIWDKVRRLLNPEEVEGGYDLTAGVSDQPTVSLYLARRPLSRVLRVDGFSSQSLAQNPKGPASFLPKAFLEAFQYLAEFEPRNGKPWEPSYVEVILWDYGHASEESIVWPSDWPTLDSERTIRRGDAFSIFLDGDKLPDLRKFLATCRPNGAVEVDGRKLSVAYRLCFPSELVWRKAFRSD